MGCTHVRQRESRRCGISGTSGSGLAGIKEFGFAGNSESAFARKSAKRNSIQERSLFQSGCALSEPAGKPRWCHTPRLASIPCVESHITLVIPFHHFFSFSPSPVVIEHSGIVDHCDHSLEWVDSVCACIGIAM